MKHINVLLVGEVGAGKSSFFNSVESVFTGHVVSRAEAGLGGVDGMGASLTTEVLQYFTLYPVIFSVPAIHCQQQKQHSNQVSLL